MGSVEAENINEDINEDINQQKAEEEKADDIKQDNNQDIKAEEQEAEDISQDINEDINQVKAEDGEAEDMNQDINQDIIKLKAELENKGALDVECLVFKGGGVKGLAYKGAVKALEDLGVVQKVKRVAGTSAGSMVATIIAVGGTSEDVDGILMKTPLKSLICDSALGSLALLPNILRKYGWHPGTALFQRFRNFLKEKTGNPDITFKELYKSRGVELCIVAANISSMSAEYCHPKTTPDLSIAHAVRCSSSLPGLLQPVEMDRGGQTEFVVDGGLVCNYPIHCYDGWYLSMKTEDSFFHRTGDEGEFEEYNGKTLGLAVYTAKDREDVYYALKNRLFKQVERPNSSLSNARAKFCDEVVETESKRHKVYEASKRFVKALSQADLDRDGEISVAEYRKAFVEGHCMEAEDMTLLFGDKFDMEATFRELDVDKNNSITATEFISFMQDKGVYFRPMAMGGTTSKPSLTNYIFGTLQTIYNWAGQLYAKPQDVERSIMLYVDYVDTDDFELQDTDKDFLFRVGYETTIWWFKQKVNA